MILGQIARLGPQSPLFQIGLFALDNMLPNSWFTHLRSLSKKYSLPDPLQILVNPPSKLHLKKLFQPKIIEFWHTELSKQAAAKPSLQFLSCPFLPLGSGPHPIWLSCRSSKSAVKMATVQAKMISGRYRTDALTSKWTGGNARCLLPGCNGQKGDLFHLLSGACPAIYPSLSIAISRGLMALQSHPHPDLNHNLNLNLLMNIFSQPETSA